MSYEDQVRRQMEEAANQQARGECPVEGEVDAAFGFFAGVKRAVVSGAKRIGSAFKKKAVTREQGLARAKAAQAAGRAKFMAKGQKLYGKFGMGKF